MLTEWVENKSFKGTYLVGYSYNVRNAYSLTNSNSNEKVQQQFISIIEKKWKII